MPYRSSWLAPIITCRRPAATTPKTARYGSQPSIVSPSEQVRLAVAEQQVGGEGEPGQPRAEPGDDAHRAGQDLAVAAPRLGARHDADLGPGASPWPPLIDGPSTGRLVVGPRRRRGSVARNALPGLRARRRRRVLPLEGLVAAVVGHAAGEVRAVRRLDHAVDHHPVDQQALRRPAGEQLRGVDEPLAGDEPARRRPGRTGRRSTGRGRGTARCRAGRRGSGGPARRPASAPASRPAPRRRRTASGPCAAAG